MFNPNQIMLFVGNRSFLLVQPKKPFVEWVNAYDEYKFPEEEILTRKTLYMVKNLEIADDAEKEKVLQLYYKKVFMHELKSWYNDKKYFPKNLTLDKFKEWFEYEFIEMCFDVLRDEIVLE